MKNKILYIEQLIKFSNEKFDIGLDRKTVLTELFEGDPEVEEYLKMLYPEEYSDPVEPEKKEPEAMPIVPGGLHGGVAIPYPPIKYAQKGATPLKTTSLGTFKKQMDEILNRGGDIRALFESHKEDTGKQSNEQTVGGLRYGATLGGGQ